MDLRLQLSEEGGIRYRWGWRNGGRKEGKQGSVRQASKSNGGRDGAESEEGGGRGGRQQHIQPR